MRYKRRLVCLFLIVCLLLQGCGAQPHNGSSAYPSPREEASSQGSSAKEIKGETLRKRLPESGCFQADSSAFGFAALKTALQRECYQKIERAVYEISGVQTPQGYAVGRIILSGALPEEEIRLVLEAFRQDQPEVFWLGNAFSYASLPGGMQLELYALYPAGACRAMQAALIQRAQEMLEGLTQEMQPFERELFLHDALLAGCVYQETPGGKEESPMLFTAYGALVEGHAVCEGYAAAVQLLLRAAGLPVRQVNGAAGGTPHAWNAVELEGEWYHLDATWNATAGACRYDYFNITSEAILTDHTIAPDYAALSPRQLCGEQGKPALFNLSLPDCGGTAQNYFTRRALPLKGMNAENDALMIAALAGRIQAGETALPVQIATGLDYDSTVAMLFEEKPYKMLFYLKKANQRLDSAHQVDLAQIHYVKSKAQRAVTVAVRFLTENDGA